MLLISFPVILLPHTDNDNDAYYVHGVDVATSSDVEIGHGAVEENDLTFNDILWHAHYTNRSQKRS